MNRVSLMISGSAYGCVHIRCVLVPSQSQIFKTKVGGVNWGGSRMSQGLSKSSALFGVCQLNLSSFIGLTVVLVHAVCSMPYS